MDTPQGISNDDSDDPTDIEIAEESVPAGSAPKTGVASNGLLYGIGLSVSSLGLLFQKIFKRKKIG